MNQFIFDSRLKTILIGFMVLGLVCLGLTFAVDDELNTRFWTNYLHNTVFFTGIAFISLFILAAFTTAWAGCSICPLAILQTLLRCPRYGLCWPVA